MKDKTCTCIIPFYNEQDGVIEVLSKMVNNPYFDRILLVNDGSTDKSLFLVQQFLAEKNNDKLVLISYSHNHGKSYAIQQGLERVDTDYVFLFDSDLKQVKIKEIIYAIEHMYQHPEIDMGILRRVYAKRYIKLFYRELILSGQRMLRTEDLKKVFEQKFEKYQLEVAINTFMQKQKKIVVWYPFSGENTFKTEKWGFVGGWQRDFSMFRDIFAYQGLLGYVKHSFLFSPINEKKYKSKF